MALEFILKIALWLLHRSLVRIQQSLFICLTEGGCHEEAMLLCPLIDKDNSRKTAITLFGGSNLCRCVFLHARALLTNIVNDSCNFLRCLRASLSLSLLANYDNPFSNPHAGKQGEPSYAFPNDTRTFPLDISNQNVTQVGQLGGNCFQICTL